MAKRVNPKQLNEIIKQMKSAKAVEKKEITLSVSEAKEAMVSAVLSMYKKGYDAKQIAAFVKNLGSPVALQIKEINSMIKAANDSDKGKTEPETEETVTTE